MRTSRWIRAATFAFTSSARYAAGTLPSRRKAATTRRSTTTGETITRIPTEPGAAYPSRDAGPPWTRSVGPHNTWINEAGTRVYLGAFTVPFVTIVDTRTHEVVGRVGPFSKGVRPFTVSPDERYVFANVDGLLGFEVALAKTEDGWGGPMVHRVAAATPADRVAALRRPG